MLKYYVVWLFVVLSVFQDTQARAQGAEAVLTVQQERTDWVFIAPVVFYLRDPGWALTIADVQQAEFTKLTRPVLDFGYIQDVTWVRFDLHNGLSDDELILAVRENFLQHYELWLEHPGQAPVRIDFQNSDSPFSNRLVAYPELSTLIPLAQGQKAAVYIRYWSGGESELSWKIFGKSHFDEFATKRTARNFIFYGMFVLLITTAVLCWLFTRRPVFLTYAMYACSGFLYIMHADGNTFQYLWPYAPRFNADASAVIGLSLIVSSMLFARTFLSTRLYHPILDRIIIAFLIAAAVMAIAPLFVGMQQVKRILILMAFTATVMLAVFGFLVARTRFREVRFYVIAWMGAVASSGIMMMRHWLGIEISEEVQYDSIRIFLLFDAALMGFAILDRINWLRQSRQQVLETSLAQAQKAMELNRRLQDLEEQVSTAEQLAISQERSLAQTAHDIRQPLNALRLNLRNVMGSRADPAQVTDVEETLEYLETLVSEQVTTALAEKEQTQKEATDLGEILVSAGEMFAADAVQKGLSLRIVESSVRVGVPPLAMMRIITNLISNAIKATESGCILIGVRHAGGARIELFDTGPGLPRDLFEQAMSGDGSALPSDSGSGLGLGIVAQLTHEHGIRTELVETAGSGTHLRLWLPCAKTV